MDSRRFREGRGELLSRKETKALDWFTLPWNYGCREERGAAFVRGLKGWVPDEQGVHILATRLTFVARYLGAIGFSFVDDSGRHELNIEAPGSAAETSKRRKSLAMPSSSSSQKKSDSI
jgi:hypothetical protein